MHTTAYNVVRHFVARSRRTKKRKIFPFLSIKSIDEIEKITIAGCEYGKHGEEYLKFKNIFRLKSATCQDISSDNFIFFI